MRPRLPSLFRAAILSCAAASLAACQTTGAPGPEGPKTPKAATSEPEATPAAASDFETIDREAIPEGRYWSLVKKGRLRVIVGEAAAPFSMEVGGERIGLDVDLARRLGAVLGVDIDFIPLPLAEVIPALTGPAPKGDIVLANLTATAARQARVNFTEPYLVVSQAAIVEKRLVQGESQRGGEIERESYESYDDLAKLDRLVIGVKADSVPARTARRSFPRARIQTYPSVDEALAALKAGQVQAVTHDAPALRLWARRNAAELFRFKTLFKPVTRDPLSMAIRKGDIDFLLWLNAFIAEQRHDGFLGQLQRRYIEKLEWLSR